VEAKNATQMHIVYKRQNM